MNEILDAMKATNAVFETEVVQKRNYAALERVYTKDSRILPPGGAMVSGREAIIEFWSQAIPALDAQEGTTLTTVEATLTGDGVVEIGAARLVTQGGNIDIKYVVFWKQEEGVWKWHVDIWNANA